jgi:exopolysaccharide production protein ExoZ
MNQSRSLPREMRSDSNATDPQFIPLRDNAKPSESALGYLASIQFLRFIAATLVVFFHTTVALHKYFGGSLLHSFVNNAAFGASGVHIFFVISGFIMVYTSFRAKNDEFKPATFAFRRLTRIYPIYFVYSLFYLYFYSTFAAGKNLSIGQLFGSILLLPGYSGLIIGPGWTLSYEVYFYLCFGIAMLLGLTRGLVALTAFFGAAIAAGIVFGKSNQMFWVFTNSLLIEFLFGAWIGYAVVSKVRLSNHVASLLLLAAFSIFGAGIAFGYSRLPSLITWGVPSAMLVAGLIVRESNGSVPSTIKRFAFLGDSSYSLYLLHVVLIDAIIFSAIGFYSPITERVMLIGPLGIVGICFMITAFCIVVALVSYEFIERRLLAWLQNLRRRRIIMRDKRQA